MIPLEVRRQPNIVKVIFWLFCASLAALAAVIPAQTKNALATPPLIEGIAGMTKGYCYSDLNGPTVYFSNIFDANTKARNKISTAPLNLAFKNYLVEEYDFKTNSNYPTQCSLFETLSQAEASKQQFMSQAQQANKEVREVNWNPSPVTEVPQGGDSVAIGPNGPPPTHTFCAVGVESTMYFSAVFDTAGALINPAWNDAFNEFLRKTYGVQPEVDATCTIMNTVREAERNLNARVGGVRANNHKAVETGWKFGSTSTASVRPGPRPRPTPKDDDDPERTPPRPATPKAPPSQSINEFATKELPLVLDYCQKDPMLSKIFDCDRVQRSVYNYRMEHGSSEPLASLFTQEKVNLAGAIAIGLNLWVKQRAAAQGLSNKVSNCIEQKVNVSFYERPYISQLQKIYNASVAACK